MVATVAPFEPSDPFVDLASNSLSRQPSAWAKAAIVAKRAPTDGECPIDVGTSKTGIDADPLDTVAEFLAKKVVVTVVSKALTAPINSVDIFS
jgi:hypothetical protein